MGASVRPGVRVLSPLLWVPCRCSGTVGRRKGYDMGPRRTEGRGLDSTGARMTGRMSGLRLFFGLLSAAGSCGGAAGSYGAKRYCLRG